MRWGAQLLHVARKDARSVRWVLAVFGVLLVAGSVTTVHDVSGNRLLIAMLLSVASMVLMAVVVQHDSPIRPDAFWATRPLNATAVFAAKVLLAVALTVIVLLAHGYALYMHGLARADYPGLLGQAGAALLVPLMIAIVIAALTRDIGGFVLTLILVVVAASTAAALLPEHDGPERTTAVPWLGLLTLLVALCLGCAVYLWRDARRGAAVAVVAIVFLGGVDWLLDARAAATIRTDSPIRQVGTVITAGDVGRGVVQVHLHGVLPAGSVAAGAAGDVRAVLYPWRAVLRGRDGVETGVQLVHGRGVSMEQRPMAPGLAVERPAGPLLTMMNLTAAQMAEFQAGTAQLVVAGEVGVERRQELGTLDLADGSTLAAGGYRVRIVPGSVAPGAAVDVAVSAVGAAGYDAARLEFILVGSAGDTVRIVERRSSGGAGALITVTGSGWYRRSTLMAPEVPPSPPPLWPAAPRLRVNAWREVERYPVRITPSLEPEAS